MKSIVNTDFKKYLDIDVSVPMEFYIDASVGSTFSSSSKLVSHIQDMSSNRYLFTALRDDISADRANINHTIFNNHKSYNTDGKVIVSLSSPIEIPQSFTYFTVVYPTVNSGVNFRTLFRAKSMGASSYKFLHRFDASNQQTVHHDGYTITGTLGFSLNTKYIYTVIREISGGNCTYTLYRNGELDNTATTAILPPSYIDDEVKLWNESISTTSFFGYVAKHFMYNGVLSTDQINEVHNLLSIQYDITITTI